MRTFLHIVLYAALAALPGITDAISKTQVLDTRARWIIALVATYQALVAIRALLDQSTAPDEAKLRSAAPPPPPAPPTSSPDPSPTGRSAAITAPPPAAGS